MGGFEPPTVRLRIECSTTELHRHSRFPSIAYLSRKFSSSEINIFLQMYVVGIALVRMATNLQGAIALMPLP
jgi:hypothetical protein